ncbi:MAG: ATP-binding cassette domain-containing protein, partial [Candidatus Atribacteria bacterium]|nr:ATP-binding cassette domain-containing protein [Candidatus Atribacteria bacterium]
MAFIDFDKVYKIYTTGLRALQNVTLSIEVGEFIFCVGPTGAGKTTLMKLLTREEFPTSG